MVQIEINCLLSTNLNFKERNKQGNEKYVQGSSTTCMMRDFILYLQEWVILGLLLLVALKLLAMHGLPLSYNKNQKNFVTNSPKRENANELDDEMSEIEPLKAGEMIEPIVFEPKRKIRLSRSTYKVNSYIDFRPYQNSFKKFETYLHRFSRDLQDPDYVGALVNMNRFKEENYEYILKREKSYFGPTTCREATYDCRVKKQYTRIMFETNKLKQLFNKIHGKFLKAINHMEFHPTLGKEKKGTSYRLHRCSTKDRDASMIHQMRYLSPDDIEMLRQGNEIIQKKYLKVNNTKHRTKRFCLATWILGWGVYRNA